MDKQIFLIAFAIIPLFSLAQQNINIIPQPVQMTINQGVFIINNHTTIEYPVGNKEIRDAVIFFNMHIKQISGFNLLSNKKGTNQINFKLQQDPTLGKEGYRLDITPVSVHITANTNAGIIYAIQTLFQMLPTIRTNQELALTCLEITDYPRFQWRGMHLDVSRHFFSPDFIKQYIDLLASYKMNVFHWHLTDDQGWRIEIKKYPKLTEYGAWRAYDPTLPWDGQQMLKKGEKGSYGGYYTQEQIREIVKYASERNVTIVPEIEMPGHSAAALAAYPELSCNKHPQQPVPGGNYGDLQSVYCVGNDSVFTFLENVLSEVIDLFPSLYIHIGGDEVEKSSWKNCKSCQQLKKRLNLKDENELQSYFIKRIEKFINSKNRKLIGWDEILEGGLAPDATVMSWRGEIGGIEAARMKHLVVMTPGDPLYFNYYQADPATEPVAFGGLNTLKMVYDYDPIPTQLEEQYHSYILGAQANLWTEYIASPLMAEYMLMPRLLALSEIVWSPKNKREWNNFNERLQHHFQMLSQKGINFCTGNFKPSIQPTVQNGKVSVALSTEAYHGELYYSLDGSDPSVFSNKYVSPIAIDTTLTLKAITVVNGKNMSIRPASQLFVKNKATGKYVHYTNAISPMYIDGGNNALTDGIRANGDNIHKFWHGISGKDLIATIDLGKEQQIHRIAIGFLQHYVDWIMMPQWVKFEVSDNGKDFKVIDSINNTVPVNQKTIIKDFSTTFPIMKTRWIRITAKAIDGLPSGHPGEGLPGWIFADEIMVE